MSDNITVLNRQEISVITFCPLCKKEHQVIVDKHDWIAYKTKGKLCQDAFPYLSPCEREMLITGTCPECWDTLFKPEEE